MSQELVNHLDRQLQFLENSCWLYDQGMRDEGIRLATIIRVLVHQAVRSNALLNQLNASAIDVLDSSRPIPSPLTEPFLGLVLRDLSPLGCVLSPNFDVCGPGILRNLQDWWTQVVGIDSKVGVRLTRMDIVLAVSNKDGGAHVDKLPEKYAHLARPGYFEQVTDLGGPFIEAHCTALRQMAYELLNSPALVQIAETADPPPKRVSTFPAPSFLRMTRKVQGAAGNR
jgi:hypothetical protein